MSYPAYPEYKDSGVEWLGEVPAHWAIERLKLSTVSCQNGLWGSEPQGDENDVICIRVADFDRTHMRVKLDTPTYRNVTEAEFKSRKVTSGDLLLEKSGGGEKQPVGFVALYDAEEAAVCANFIARIKLAPEMNSSFWRYVHAAGYAIGLNIPSIKQTSGIQNLDQHSYLNERAAYPPSVEQDYIAAFLDHETARIDALVEEQQRLIELLKEKRQALISHAVTKGLDPDVPMKDSGVEWLGEVPMHWEVLRNKSCFGLTSGYAFKSEFFQKGAEEGQVLITPGVFNEFGSLYFSSKNTVKYSGPREKSFELQSGDLVMVLTDLSYKKLILGRAAFVRRSDALLNQRVAKISVVSGVDEKYLWLTINSDVMREQVMLSASGATVFHTSPEKIDNCWMALPPIEEQKKIAKFVESSNLELFKLTQEALSAIELLNERRSALISAAVTGKIDVRGWQPPEKLQAANDAQKGHEVAAV